MVIAIDGESGRLFVRVVLSIINCIIFGICDKEEGFYLRVFLEDFLKGLGRRYYDILVRVRGSVRGIFVIFLKFFILSCCWELGSRC